MFAAVRRYDASGEIDDEVVSIVRDRFMPKLQSLAGFVDYYVVRGDDGTLATVSIFDGRDQAAGSSELAERFIREEGMADLLPASPQTTVGEVVAHAGRAATAA